MKQLRRIFKYIQHFFTARHTYGFRVHSPYIFNFTKYVIYEKNPYYFFEDIEKRRKELEKDNRTIYVEDFGTGKSGEKKIKDIAGSSLKSSKYSQLLFRIAKDNCAQNILELGTSLGITTAYLASSSENSRCVTMEGSPEIANIASETLRKLNLENVEILTGDINNNLSSAIDKFEKLDLVFIDANHTCEAVLNYFNQCLYKTTDNTIIVIDDIYWSKDMEQAWSQIKQHEKVTATIDLFQIGIVFFNKNLHKKHYRMIV